jgi:hypothetical protein
MLAMTRITPIALLAMMAAAQAPAADIDRTAVDFTPPSEIIHYANKVHYDGAKNEETIIQVWGMGPATSTPAWKK